MRATVADALADALEHHKRGRLSEAEAGYRQVLQTTPDEPEALHRLGIIAHQRGRNELALQLIDRATAVNPVHPTYHHDAGIVLHALGRIDDAIARYRKALMLGSSSPRLWHNIGNALQDLGAFADAAEAYRRALALEPDFADARASRGGALFALGRPDEAVADYARALRVRETPESIAGFVQSFVAAKLGGADEDVRAIAIRALSTPWARPAQLAMACIRLIANGAEIRAAIDRSWNAWPSRLTSRELFFDGRDAVFDDLLLRTLLVTAPVCDLQMERFLTLARHALQEDATAETGRPSAPRLAFCCALARQCFINDYVFSYTPPEIDRARALRDRLAASLRLGEAPAAMTIAVICAYFPLASIAGAESLMLREWPEPVAALLEQQLREPLDERTLRDRVPRLTPVDDEVSISVRQQYEEHPYPRWVRLPPFVRTGLEGADDRVAQPSGLPSDERTTQAEILVAGCGTGQESIEVAQQFPRARVLAVDLSLASLAYAERKARELGVGNVVHAQADLMQLGSLGRRFDLIYSVGVLHHLADPVRGWQELVSVLAADGRMLVGLYSERSRQDVVAARAFIAERGYVPTAPDIRRCRQDLMSFERGVPFSRLALRADFYVTGECRDLLFHVREHRFTLPEIRGNLDALGLRFDGFVLNAQFARYFAERYRSNAGLEALDDWEAFEAEFPDAFAGMYIFWVRKEP